MSFFFSNSGVALDVEQPGVLARAVREVAHDNGLIFTNGDGSSMAGATSALCLPYVCPMTAL